MHYPPPFVFQCHDRPRALHFPYTTLFRSALACVGYGTAIGVIRTAHEAGRTVTVWVDETRPVLQGARLTAWELDRLRSEEHTSELQSRRDLVCRLLLEKKNRNSPPAYGNR